MCDIVEDWHPYDSEEDRSAAELKIQFEDLECEKKKRKKKKKE